MNMNTVTISAEEYDVLQEARKWQIALELAGIAEWGGMPAAHAFFQRIERTQESPGIPEDAEADLDNDDAIEVPIEELVRLRSALEDAHEFIDLLIGD